MLQLARTVPERILSILSLVSLFSYLCSAPSHLLLVQGWWSPNEYTQPAQCALADACPGAVDNPITLSDGSSALACLIQLIPKCDEHRIARYDGLRDWLHRRLLQVRCSAVELSLLARCSQLLC